MVRALAEPGKAYAVYAGPDLRGKKPARDPVLEVVLEAPAGGYRVEWLDPVTGRRLGREQVEHAGGRWRLKPPEVLNEVALKIER
jgi:hypothetical protein